MSTVSKYRYRCNTEGIDVTEDVYRESVPTECMNNPAHEIDTDSITALDTITDEDVHILNTIDADKEPIRVVQAPGHTGYYMCCRDVKLRTAVYAASDTFQDLRVNPATNKRENWGEMSHVGCYKLENDAYVQVASQTEAETDAVLSVWDYIANDLAETPTPVAIDFKGGGMWIDPTISDSWEHQVYAMLAPNIPPEMGGGIRFCDAFLLPYKGTWVESCNSICMLMDPTGPAGQEAVRLRIWIYYPTGEQKDHVFKFLTYRDLF
jgi:hypothetical protein